MVDIRRPLGVNRRVRTSSPLLLSSPMDLLQPPVTPPVPDPPPVTAGLDAPWRLLEAGLLFTWLRSLQFDTFWLPMAPKMETIWIPKVVDFRSHENLDFGDPSHSLEGSRESIVDAFCRLFQLLSRASVESSPGHILADFGSLWEPKMVPKCV